MKEVIPTDNYETYDDNHAVYGVNNFGNYSDFQGIRIKSYPANIYVAQDSNDFNSEIS